MTTEASGWYKDAIIYQLHVKSFFDANHDGTGDFAGLIEKLDYIVDLGATAVWLLPFYPSPRRDDGYDIADYRGVHPDYGTLADVRRFIREAHKRRLRVITELVVNHTSDQHPWFQRARQAPRDSAARRFYVWSDTDQKYQDARIIFLDSEHSNWAWDAVAGQYFWHRFYAHQPDLNYDNPAVLREIMAVLRFWLRAGVDGLRLDAVPYLIERDGTSCENLPETHAILRRIRAETERLYPDCMLLAEANQWPEDAAQYFGDGDECHMAFHFPLMPRMYMAIAQEDRYPITNILRQTPAIPDTCQWVIFLRNHDELTLEMVSDRDRDYLWQWYADDPRARINLGIRRRLTPLMNRDRRRVELLNGLLLSMPGTPVIYYGDELGMGDNLYLGDRDGVRTPMQWSGDRNGGFSRADPAALVLPPVMDPLYGFQTVNVEAQTRDPHSLLNWTKRMLAVRREHLAFSRGDLSLLTPRNRRVLAYMRRHQSADGEQELLLCVANLAGSAQAVSLDLAAYAGQVPTELTGGSHFPAIGEAPYVLTLAPYGFYWFVLGPAGVDTPATEPAQEIWPELPTLVVRNTLAELAHGAAHSSAHSPALSPELGFAHSATPSAPLGLLASEVLPRFLAGKRWLGEQPLAAVAVAYLCPLPSPDDPGALLALGEIVIGERHWQLPIGFHEEHLDHPVPLAATLSRLRRGAREGLLVDGPWADGFAHAVMQHLAAGKTLPLGDGKLCFQPEPAAGLTASGYEQISVATGEQSNTTVFLGHQWMLKLYRALAPGEHPEAAMLRYLTRAGFAAIAPLAGEVFRCDAECRRWQLMVLQRYVVNEGDAWRWSLERLLHAGARAQVQASLPAAFARLAERLGRRLGEMHTVLAQESDQEGFGCRALAPEQAQTLARDVARQVRQALDAVQPHQAGLPASAARAAEQLLAGSETLGQRLMVLAEQSIGGVLCRVHGDLHLGQVLVTPDDVCLIDFEGEPLRPLAQRCAWHSPWKDVAGVLRSFAYLAATARQHGPGTAAMDALCSAYETVSAQRFLHAYRQASAAVLHRWASAGGEQAMLALYSIEKAAYEVMYEARHRPGWLAIPLTGLAALLAPEGSERD